jgi:hypothetical protein
MMSPCSLSKCLIALIQQHSTLGPLDELYDAVWEDTTNRGLSVASNDQISVLMSKRSSNSREDAEDAVIIQLSLKLKKENQIITHLACKG